LPREEFVDFLSTYDTEKWWTTKHTIDEQPLPEDDFPSLDELIQHESTFSYAETSSLK